MPSFQLTVAVCARNSGKDQYVQPDIVRTPRHENRSSWCWTDASDASNATPKTSRLVLLQDDHCFQDATGSEETQTDVRE
jgi:hypothetical protein